MESQWADGEELALRVLRGNFLRVAQTIHLRGLGVTGLLAAVGPVRRAPRVDPVECLRSE